MVDCFNADNIAAKFGGPPGELGWCDSSHCAFANAFAQNSVGLFIVDY